MRKAVRNYDKGLEMDENLALNRMMNGRCYVEVTLEWRHELSRGGPRVSKARMFQAERAQTERDWRKGQVRLGGQKRGRGNQGWSKGGQQGGGRSGRVCGTQSGGRSCSWKH